MGGWHHRLDGHESEQAPGDGDGQGSLACCSPWGGKDLDTTEPLNNSDSISETSLEHVLAYSHIWIHMLKKTSIMSR